MWGCAGADEHVRSAKSSVISRGCGLSPHLAGCSSSSRSAALQPGCEKRSGCTEVALRFRSPRRRQSAKEDGSHSPTKWLRGATVGTGQAGFLDV